MTCQGQGEQQQCPSQTPTAGWMPVRWHPQQQGAPACQWGWVTATPALLSPPFRTYRRLNELLDDRCEVRELLVVRRCAGSTAAGVSSVVAELQRRPRRRTL